MKKSVFSVLKINSRYLQSPGLKWPEEPIKALGIYYSYDEKLLREKNFIEHLDKN